MGNRARLEDTMPAMLLHEGVWTGTYRYVDVAGNVTDQYESRIECTFPDAGPFAYVQKNRYTWDDGREQAYEFGGELRGARLWWDTERFSGYGWQTDDDILMLTLDRKDEPGVLFTEMIMLAPNRDYRARTWHWFRDGKLFQRTLCDERRART